MSFFRKSPPPPAPLLRFTPQPDITISELAQCVRLLSIKFHDQAALAAALNEAPPSCRRHLQSAEEIRLAHFSERPKSYEGPLHQATPSSTRASASLDDIAT